MTAPPPSRISLYYYTRRGHFLSINPYLPCVHKPEHDYAAEPPYNNYLYAKAQQIRLHTRTHTYTHTHKPHLFLTARRNTALTFFHSIRLQ